MFRIARATAVVTMLALICHFSAPALAAGATIVGKVEVPGDRSNAGIASVHLRPVSGGSATTVAVDSSTGRFAGFALAEGEYELVPLDADGEPLAPEPKTLRLLPGLNKVALSMQSPTPVGQEPAPDPARPAKKKRLKNWHITLIYLGAVSAVALALDSGDVDPDPPASPSEP